MGPGRFWAVFERLTETRKVVVLAQEEARTLKHNYIGTEHILHASAGGRVSKECPRGPRPPRARGRGNAIRPAVAGLSPQALCRTRTGDPFLTMEVLYQLS